LSEKNSDLKKESERKEI